MWQPLAGIIRRGQQWAAALSILRTSEPARAQLLYALRASTCASLGARSGMLAYRYLSRFLRKRSLFIEVYLWRKHLIKRPFGGAPIFICTPTWAMARPARPESLLRPSDEDWTSSL